MITVLLSSALIFLGVAIIIRSVAEGVGGGLGLLFGTLFVLAGAARLYLHSRSG